MIGLGRRLFQKVLRQQPVALIRDIPLTGPDGQVIGHIDDLHYFHDRVYLCGWCLRDGLVLMAGEHARPFARNMIRPDVMQVHPDLAAEGAQVGFAIETFWPGGPVSLKITAQPGHSSAQELTIPLPVPSVMQRNSYRPQAMARFVMTSLRAAPGAALQLMRDGKVNRDALRHRFGLSAPVNRRILLDRDLFADAAATPVDVAITVVLPVYNAFDLLQEALRRLEAHTELPWHLIVVEDCSTDARVRPWLRSWALARKDKVTLLENETNLGFIGSVNRAFAAAPQDRPLVLLNSDALVPRDWAGRLVRPLLADPKVASVTPLSNDATIFSVPIIGLGGSLPEGLADEIDAIAGMLSERPTDPAPTGVGFCMAMSSAALTAVPRFDTAFGKGYGEEVDWCQRTRMLGMRHLGIGNLFVEHRGGQSFGSGTKAAAIRANGRIISHRYPSFDQDVQEYIASDPLRGPRLALGLAWAAGVAQRSGTRVPVYIGHSMGGGAEAWLSGTIAADIETGLPAVVLRLGGANRFQVELHNETGVVIGALDDKALLRRLLAPLKGHRFVYSCGVGDRAGIEIPELILDLAGSSGEIGVLFHDYWPISPSYTLVDSDNVFRGAPDGSREDIAHVSRDAGGNPVTLARWQSEWGRLVDAAQEITVFSESSAGIVSSIWPEAIDRLSLRPHRISIPDLAVGDAAWLADKPGTIAVLGGIGIYKGADYVSRIATDFLRRPDAPRLVVIGEFDLSFPLPVSIPVTGRYNVSDLPALIERYRVQAWLMPSIVPETFSFTSHEMLATGLPVFSFALGAQGDVVAGAGQGYILPDQRPETLLETFRQAMARSTGSR